MRVDPNYLINLTGAINNSSAAEAQLTSELASGLRVSSLSDDPVASAQSTLLNSAISQMDTYVQAANGVTSRMQAADSALGEAVTQLTTALSVAARASNGTQNASDESAAAQQLAGIRDTILSLANTSYAGSYLFGGSQGSTQPFTLDDSTTPATVTYSGDTAAQKIVTPAGQSIQTNLPGDAVFTSALNALNQMIADLNGPNPSTAATADSAALQSAFNTVITQRATLDSSLSKLEASSTYTQTQETNSTAAQRTLVASDPTDVATQLSASETQHEALLNVFSALGGVDLFNYMH
ncbi:MAG TPA: flagellar hook-associated protein FlgL [Granulicella sp.]